MQRRFNEGGYWERLKSGELTEVKVEYHPNTRYPEVILPASRCGQCNRMVAG